MKTEPVKTEPVTETDSSVTVTFRTAPEMAVWLQTEASQRRRHRSMEIDYLLHLSRLVVERVGTDDMRQIEALLDRAGFCKTCDKALAPLPASAAERKPARKPSK